MNESHASLSESRPVGVEKNLKLFEVVYVMYNFATWQQNWDQSDLMFCC
jgi:hypothetical protein